MKSLSPVKQIARENLPYTPLCSNNAKSHIAFFILINIFMRREKYFNKDNFYSFSIMNAIYFMAETTIPQFSIGTARLSTAKILDKVLFYQIRGISEDILDAFSSKALKRMNENDE